MLVSIIGGFVDVVLNCLSAFIDSLVDEHLVEFHLGDEDDLSISLVAGGVKINALSVRGGPVVIVVNATSTNFSLLSFPVRNTSVEVGNSINTRAFESSVFDEVVVDVGRS